VQLVSLEPHGPDVFVGLSATYEWGRVYGGQVVAQALVAACQTVAPEFAVHSLHGYFIRGGTSDEPIRFEVDRIRNGRSFLTRLVVARQSNGAILNLACSFHLSERDAEVQVDRVPDGIPQPDELEPSNWGTLLDRRIVPREAIGGRTAAWLRIKGDLGDDPLLHRYALAYASDDLPYDGAAIVHPLTGGSDHYAEHLMGASLDHALWFHRDARADDWQLHVMDGHGLIGARGLAFGQVYGLDGSHIASIAQQILLRERTR
jgi:acyl-CoA thioesterase II